MTTTDTTSWPTKPIPAAPFPNARDNCMWLLSNEPNLTANRAYEIVISICPELETDFFLRGIRAALKTWVHPDDRAAASAERAAARDDRRARDERNREYAKARGIPVDAVASHMLNETFRVITDNHRKAEDYDQIVAMLDNWIVGDIKLGDCTSINLVVAAAKSTEIASKATTHADMYRKIAATLSGNERVRDHADRSKIIDILRAAIGG